MKTKTRPRTESPRLTKLRSQLLQKVNRHEASISELRLLIDKVAAREAEKLRSNIARWIKALEMRRAGASIAEVGAALEVNRERARQIIMSAERQEKTYGLKIE